MEGIKANSDNLQALQTMFSVLNSVLHIIESFLGQEELPDFYEEQLEFIASVFNFILDFNHPSSQEIKELIKCRSKVVRLVHLYQFKFGEHFAQYQQHFFQKIWQMVLSKQVPPNKKNQKLIFSIIRYLNTVLDTNLTHEFFKNSIQQIFELLIVPNISITEDDIEEY
jgi:Cse1